jgi:hypothetical protein
MLRNPSSPSHRKALLSLAVPALLALPVESPRSLPQPVAASLSAEDILARTRALYPTLQSYADSGIVVEDTGPTGERRGSFRTYFLSASQNFFFEYRWLHMRSGPGPAIPLDYQLVFWMLRGELQTWDGQGKMHQVYPPGSDQVAPFRASRAATADVSVLVPSLIYVKAQLPGPIQQLEDVSLAGTETIGGRRCHKLLGIARSYYPSGQVAGVRPETVWIDAESYLIRQVLLDTPKGMPLGAVSRITVTLQPHLNPPLSDGLFTFAVPSIQQ